MNEQIDRTEDGKFLAVEKGIQLLGTDLAGNYTPDLYADFKINEKQKTVICPSGRQQIECL